MSARPTEGGAATADLGVAGIIESFVPGWSLGSNRTAPVPRREVATRGSELEGSLGNPRRDGADVDGLPVRPVVEVEGIVPDWLGQVRSVTYRGVVACKPQREVALPARVSDARRLQSTPASTSRLQ